MTRELCTSSRTRLPVATCAGGSSYSLPLNGANTRCINGPYQFVSYYNGMLQYTIQNNSILGYAFTPPEYGVWTFGVWIRVSTPSAVSVNLGFQQNSMDGSSNILTANTWYLPGACSQPLALTCTALLGGSHDGIHDYINLFLYVPGGVTVTTTNAQDPMSFYATLVHQTHL